MTLKEKDFIEIEYTASLEDGTVIDTTDEKLAKEKEIYSTESHYGTLTICLGRHYILQGLDAQLIGKDLGKHAFTLNPEQAFGKKDTKLVQLIPLNKFKKHGFMPQVGMQINVDNHVGTVRAISGGRVIMDFNHPLAGRDIHYDVNVIKVVTDTAAKIRALLYFLGLRRVKVKVENDTVTLDLEKEVPEQVQKELEKQIADECGIKNVVFKIPAKEKKESEKPTRSEQKPHSKA